jgi:DcmR-like sensory protein
MEWALSGAPGVDGLADYENRVNVLLARYGDAVVCAYDVTRFPSAIVEKVVRAHPYLLADGWGRKIRTTSPERSLWGQENDGTT